MHYCQRKSIRIFFGLVLPLYIVAAGCINSKNKTNVIPREHQQVRFDTVQKLKIDSIVDQINLGVQAQGLPYLLAFTAYHPTDTIKYWMNHDEPARISLAMQNGESFIWPTFFVHHGQLIFVRYRASHASDLTFYAEENMIYLKDGMIVYCEERNINLQPGELPALLRQKEYSLSRRSLTDIEKDYKEYWIAVKEALSRETGKVIH